MINDILDMSKIEAGRLDLSAQSVNLAAIVGDVVPFVSSDAQAKAVTLSTDLPGDLRFTADRRALMQIVTNLLSNAVKFTPAGGAVSVSARRADATIVLCIRDTGIGIPASHLEGLGRPFVQVENQFTKCHKGSGLGLAISRSLAELHGGRMRIESCVGVGTTVEVRLPVVPVMLAGSA
jgi:two-component system cell cycle sensor histidine kinase PleC